ncbi:MAG TPA: dockerin type I repeat-containing protein, partial [Tepidisphaeraceae bacterium]|nr:dockerin type I repeat-containing protein [Tepidisphaeraceae bacterium]
TFGERSAPAAHFTFGLTMRQFDPDQDPLTQLPTELRDALIRSQEPPVAVPPQMDRAILSEARRIFAERRRRWVLIRRIGAAVAAAAVLAIAVRVYLPRQTPPAPVASAQHPQPLIQVADINHDGHVDIVDALIVAQHIARHEPLDPTWDVNGDGIVDQKDVDLIAQMAVQAAGREGMK